MRAVTAQSLDSIDDYRLLDVEQPQPAADEVVVQVAACGVGYVDALVALGRYQVAVTCGTTTKRVTVDVVNTESDSAGGAPALAKNRPKEKIVGGQSVIGRSDALRVHHL